MTEFYSEDLNAVPLGTGYTPAVIAACLASAGGTKASATACTPDASAIVAARALYNAAFPYYNYIVRNTTGFYSNYNGLQVTLDARNFHGVSFLTAYTLLSRSRYV